MVRDVWILPVGLEYDRVLEALRIGGREFHIVYSGTDDRVSDAAQGFATRIEAYLRSGPFEVKGSHPVDVLDLGACIRCLKKIVTAERQEPGEAPRFRINVATSSKIMALASFYVAAQEPEWFELYYPRAKNYVIMDVVEIAEGLADAHNRGEDTAPLLNRLSEIVTTYRTNGWTRRSTEGYGIVSVPVIPIQELSRTQKAIMHALFLESGSGFESNARLAEALFSDEALGAKELDGAKSSVSFALQNLVRWNLVTQRPAGKRKEIALTEAGRLYCEVFLREAPTPVAV